MKKLTGFTLIESVIVIVVMGIAMLTITSFLAPEISRSADPHYQTRAAALGQSVMTQILARNFDEHSGTQGGLPLCSAVGESDCTDIGDFGKDSGESDNNPATYNDVDDFQGCWEPLATNGCRDLNLLVGSSSYVNFRLDVAVTYAIPNQLKQIELKVSASNQTPIELNAYRGNY